MFAIVLSGVLIGSLIVLLAVVKYRERRALGLDRPTTSRPDPVLVDRPFDPGLCAYCEDPSRFACPACNRPVCGMHKPWLEHQFCYSCEGEWESKSGRRKLVLLPIMALSMAGLAVLCFLAIELLERMGNRSDKLSLVAFIGPIVIAAPVYLGTERYMRRWFRQRGGLPQATTRRV